MQKRQKTIMQISLIVPVLIKNSDKEIRTTRTRFSREVCLKSILTFLEQQTEAVKKISYGLGQSGKKLDHPDNHLMFFIERIKS